MSSKQVQKSQYRVYAKAGDTLFAASLDTDAKKSAAAEAIATDANRIRVLNIQEVAQQAQSFSESEAGEQQAETFAQTPSIGDLTLIMKGDRTITNNNNLFAAALGTQYDVVVALMDGQAEPGISYVVCSCKKGGRGFTPPQDAATNRFPIVMNVDKFDVYDKTA